MSKCLVCVWQLHTAKIWSVAEQTSDWLFVTECRCRFFVLHLKCLYVEVTRKYNFFLQSFICPHIEGSVSNQWKWTEFSLFHSKPERIWIFLIVTFVPLSCNWSFIHLHSVVTSTFILFPFIALLKEIVCGLFYCMAPLNDGLSTGDGHFFSITPPCVTAIQAKELCFLLVMRWRFWKRRNLHKQLSTQLSLTSL